MGKEAHVRAMLPGGATDEGRLQYEPPKLIFRGAERRAWDGAGLAGVRAEGAELVLADGARFGLGERQAASWADAILNPRGRLDKLGVKPGQRVALANLDDPDFSAELAGRVTATGLEPDLDLIFYGADSAQELAGIDAVASHLGPKGALWIVSLKGKALTVKDVDVMAAAKACGLVNSKVCAFSDTRTALRFTRRR